MGGPVLSIALRDLARTTSDLRGISVSFHEKGDTEVATLDNGMHLYRIAQEAVNNSAQHGSAKSVTIILSRDQDALRLTVVDDGKGLVSSPGRKRGMGLPSMRYRAQALGGELRIESNSRQRNDRFLRNTQPSTPACDFRSHDQVSRAVEKKEGPPCGRPPGFSHHAGAVGREGTGHDGVRPGRQHPGRDGADRADASRCGDRRYHVGWTERARIDQGPEGAVQSSPGARSLHARGRPLRRAGPARGGERLHFKAGAARRKWSQPSAR